MNEELLSAIDLAFSDKEQPNPIRKELCAGHENPENSFLYKSLRGRGWRDVSDDMITATYSSLYLLSDRLFAFYLPAIMTYIVNTGDITQVEDLCLRLFPHRRGRTAIDRNTLFYRYALTRIQTIVLDVFFRDVLNHPDLCWKERALIEDYLKSH